MMIYKQEQASLSRRLGKLSGSGLTEYSTRT